MEDELRTLVSFGIALLLVMLRFDAERFGAAEYDEASLDGRSPVLRWRLTWYLIGLVLVLLAGIIHPNTGGGLFLRPGDLLEAVFYGLAFAAVGALQAVAFAWLRDRRLRMPPNTLYPGAALGSVATALIDEAAFRGLLLAFLIGFGMDPVTANVTQAILYALATRQGAPGRDLHLLVLLLIVGLFSGWLTIITGGIGAAFIGHAVTRFAVFLTTARAGHAPGPGLEADDGRARRRVPARWRTIGAEDAAAER